MSALKKVEGFDCNDLIVGYGVHESGQPIVTLRAVCVDGDQPKDYPPVWLDIPKARVLIQQVARAIQDAESRILQTPSDKSRN